MLRMVTFHLYGWPYARSLAMSYDEDALLLDLIGQDYDNFDEPIPASNHPPLLRGLVASFLVGSP